MKKTEIVANTERLVTPIIEENHFELVDVEYVKEGSNWYLRVYADKEGGINIDDCVLISRALEAKLDEEDFIEDAYILEVSSPGLGRPLKKDKDFERNLGKPVELKRYKAYDNRKEFEGILTGYTEDTVTFSCEGYLGRYENRVRDVPYFCHAGVNIASVLIDGRICACPNIDRDAFSQGSIYEDNFYQVWQERFRPFRDHRWTRRGPCADCKVWRDCLGGGMHNWHGACEAVLNCHWAKTLAGK